MRTSPPDAIQTSSQTTPTRTPLVVVFDGNCAVCRKQVELLRARDRAGVLEFVPNNAPDLQARFPQLQQAAIDESMHVVMPDGGVRAGAAAACEIAVALRRWRWLSVLYKLPLMSGFMELAYRFVARRRYRLGGQCRDGQCEVRRG